MEEITEKDGVEDKVNISETMQLSWRKGSKQGVQRLSVKSSEGNSEKKKKSGIASLRKEPQTQFSLPTGDPTV